MRVRIHWAWLVPVLLLTTFLGAFLLTYDALWFDEWVTHFITNTGEMGQSSDYFGNSTVTHTMCEVLGDTSHTPLHTLCIAAIDNSWPPLFFGFISLWNMLSDGNYYINRILALLIGLIGVSMTYRMASDIVDKKTGFIASLLLGTTIFFTFYLHEIRGYTLYTTVPAINGWLYWQLLKNKKAGRAMRWGFALSIMVTLYTHYIGIAVVFGIGLYHVLFERPDNLMEQMKLDEEERSEEAQQWISILKLYINGCLTYGLWIGVLFISFFNESLNPRSVSTFSLLSTMMRGFSNNLWFISLPAILVTLVTIRERNMRFLWVWGLSILGVAMLGNIFADFLFHPRHIMGLMPIFMTLVAVGLIFIGKHSSELVTWGIVLVWVGAGIFYGSSTKFMNALPQHLDAVPLVTMETIVATAETCGTDSDTFIYGWNIPDEEWVQDLIIDYYLYDTSVANVTISRILDDENVDLHVTPLMPDDIAYAGVDVRYNYFVEDAERVFMFVRPSIPIQDSVSEIQSRLEADGFSRCEYLNRDDLVADIYVRDAESCEAVIQTCGE